MLQALLHISYKKIINWQNSILLLFLFMLQHTGVILVTGICEKRQGLFWPHQQTWLTYYPINHSFEKVFYLYFLKMPWIYTIYLGHSHALSLSPTPSTSTPQHIFPSNFRFLVLVTHWVQLMLFISTWDVVTNWGHLPGAELLTKIEPSSLKSHLEAIPPHRSGALEPLSLFIFNWLDIVQAKQQLWITNAAARPHLESVLSHPLPISSSLIQTLDWLQCPL